MDKSNSQQNQPKRERRFKAEQYEMLKRCSEKEDISEWNEWRKAHPDENVLLEGAKLQCAYLKRALLNTGLNSGFSREVYLEGAKLHGAHLEYADFSEAHLKDVKLIGAHLKGVDLRYARLEGADFRRAIVDGSTLLWRCDVDRDTDFRSVGLYSARIEAGKKHLLEYNIRRMNWEDWYKEHKRLKWVVQPFWWISDYGRSTGRIIFTFFIISFLFAAIYYICGLFCKPGIVSSLLEGKEGLVPNWLVPFRVIYFSIVTMTTLGFGDMHANCQSFWGHLLLTVQVILGYVLLGALVTRFAVLFTGGGPSDKFADEKKMDSVSSTE